MENKKQQWCIVQFKNGGTEIVPHNWLHGDKLLWPPFTTKERSKIHAAVKNCLQPGDGWTFYEPVRCLISRDTYDEAQRSLQRYLKENCDTTDMQSEEEFDGRQRRKSKPNPVYSQDVESEEEGTEVKKKKFAQAPRIEIPAEQPGIVGAATSSSGMGKSSRNIQGLSPAGAQCGPLYSDLKPALSLEKYVHHLEPHFHQRLPAADEEVEYWPFNEMPQSERKAAPSHSMGEYYSLSEGHIGPQYTQAHFPGSHTYVQRMESPDSRQIIKDIAYSKMSETLAELVTEVKGLRLEVQGFLRRQVPISPSLPLSLPLKDLSELEEAERILQSEDARRSMVGRFSIVGGPSVEARIRRMLACTLTNELASQMNWAGKKIKNEEKRKTAFRDTRLKMCMFDALQLNSDKKEASEFLFSVTVQKWLRYAPERLGGIARGGKL